MRSQLRRDRQIMSKWQGMSTKWSVVVVLMAVVLLKGCFAESIDEANRNTTTVRVVESVRAEGDIPDLENAESKDPAKKVEIIKQIRKINKDGSYTVGYEAGDGTFKIESRDVLGNVKGTYGYVDANGEIKRVSYTGTNGTSALRNYPIDVETAGTKDELSTTLPNANAIRGHGRSFPISSTTRRPQSLQFLSSTPPASYGTKSSVIQTIPKRRIAVPSSTERSLYSHYATSKLTESTSSTTTDSSNKEASDETTQTSTTIVYAKSIPTQKPLLIIRPTTQVTSSTDKTPEQIGRPDKLEINHVSKVMVMKSSDTSTSKSVGKEKEAERKSIRGNNLRRQLTQEREDHYEASPQHLYTQSTGEDSTHIYDGTNGNLRPLFTTTSRPRVPSIVLAARQRAAQLQNAIGSSSPTTTTEKVYVRPPAAVRYETTTEPAQETNYLTQTPGPVVQIPANQAIVQQATEDEGRVYRQRPTPFIARQSQLNQPPQYQGTESPRSLYRFPAPPNSRGNTEQFIRETTPSPSRFGGDVDDDDTSYNRAKRPISPYSGQQNEGGYEQGSYPIPYQQPFLPYQQFGGPGFGGGFPQRPVTTRDFERLLQLLVYRHQAQSRFGGFGGPFGGFGGYQQPYYPGYQGMAHYLPNPYQGLQQYPRSSLYDPVSFDPRYSHLNRIGGFRQYSEPEGSVYQGQNSATDPAAQSGQQQQQQQQGYDGQRLVPRQKQYTPSYFGANTSPALSPYQPRQTSQQQSYLHQPQADYSSLQGSYASQGSENQQEYLPSEVREDLLYRMLMLAIQPQASEPMPQLASFSAASSSPVKTTITSPASLRKPVRSVQIIGEE